MYLSDISEKGNRQSTMKTTLTLLALCLINVSFPAAYGLISDVSIIHHEEKTIMH